MTKQSAHPKHAFLSGGGECGERIRAIDWANTSLGPVEQWPQSLRTSVGICLNSNFPICIYWGPDLVLIYNDFWAPIPGNKHPWALGKTALEVWPEIWDSIGPLFANTFKGEATGSKDALLLMNRHGYTEECFFDFTFTPITGDDGQIGGVFNAVIETTYRVINERRNSLLQTLNRAISNPTSREAVCQESMRVLAEAKIDLPFSLIYLIGQSGDVELSAASFDVEQVLKRFSPASAEAAKHPLFAHFQTLPDRAGQVHLTEIGSVFSKLPEGPWPEPVQEALVLRLLNTAGASIGFFVAGISPRRALDHDYRQFLEDIAANISTELNRIDALLEAQQRSEQLSELDRAKTAFFTNISHEFRTPLTLILGPLEELLRQDKEMIPESSREHLDASYRNSLRLLRMVNMLLDFSRIESGRMDALFQATDLPAYTIDLASNFRSAIEKAGLRYEVEIQALDLPVYVDLSMWEKIVLNLISNAFKYTHEGRISIRMERINDHAVLKVEDTGIGIPEQELPHMFDRFHRVQNAVGRSYEGSGIGLSLVRELVVLHGGEIAVESRLGAGSIFTLRIPLGNKHLPTDQISDQKGTWSESALTAMLLSESGQFVAAENEPPNTHFPQKDKQHILIVDDNADMRAYVQQLLLADYNVQSAANGLDALEKIKTSRPDLIISDLMMPVMDGEALLKTLKENTVTAAIPVILLSARAGEDAKVSGFDAGADDYLVKPFVARELLARVRGQLKIANTRRRVEQELIHLFEKAPVAIAVFRGPEYIIESANQRMLDVWDKTAEQVLFKPMFEAIPEVTGQGFEAILANVYGKGERFVTQEAPVTLSKNGLPVLMYFNIVFEPVRKEDQAVTGILVAATDVTEQVLARQTIEESEARMREVFMQSPFSVMIFRGPELRIDLANAYCLQMLGKSWEELANRPIAEVFPGLAEDGRFNNHLEVLHTGKRKVISEHPLSFLRQGKLYHGWYDTTYEPLRDSANTVVGVIAIGTDVTEQVESRKKIEESEKRYVNLLMESPFAVAIFKGEKLVIELANDAMKLMLGKGPDIEGKPLFDVLIEMRDQAFPQLLNDVYTLGKPYIGNEMPGQLLRNGVMENVYFNFVYQPFREADGTISGVTAIAYEVTTQAIANKKIEASEANIRNLFVQAPVAICVLRGPDHVVELANDRMLELWGTTAGQVMLKPIFEGLPEAAEQGFEALLDGVYQTGERFVATEVPINLPRVGGIEQIYVNFVYEALRESDGTISGVIALVTEVTAQVEGRQKIEESERRYRALSDDLEKKVQERTAELAEINEAFEHAEAISGMGNFKIDFESQLVTWSKNLYELYEVSPDAFSPTIDNVLSFTHPEDFELVAKATQTAYDTQSSLPVTYRIVTGKGRIKYIYGSGKIITDAGGKKLMVGTSQDVTAEKEKEQRLLDANEQLQQKNQEIALSKYNKRFLTEFSERFSAYQIHTEFFNSLVKYIADLTHLDYVLVGKLDEMDPESYCIETIAITAFGELVDNISYPLPDGPCEQVVLGNIYAYPEACRITFPKNQTLVDFEVEGYIGYPLFDMNGKAKGLIAVMHKQVIEDVETVSSILKIVAKRAEIELERIHHEQELQESNRMLAENNAALEKSNRDLEQFAHIASHDLQEPLRKIQTFANLLQRRGNDPEELTKYVHKIEDSAARMSQLIQSVLNYSRVAEMQSLFEPTDLDQLMARIRIDFELMIEEKHAVIETGPMPTIMGDPLQLSQLFSNLMSNALKFSTEHPLIRIQAQPATAAEIKARPQLDVSRPYIHILFEDNGIGFSQQYSERIFAIFQRLHDKQTYSGTGIGLAICKKIVDNHGGDISAVGSLGKGARFDILLPAMQ